MFGLDTKRCSIAGTDLQPAPPKTARNKANPKNSLPKRISQLQRIAHPLSTLECPAKWEKCRDGGGRIRQLWRTYCGIFLVWKIQRRTRMFAFAFSLPATFHFSIACWTGTVRLKKLNLFLPAAAPKFPDAAGCRCSNVCALAASGRLILSARQTPRVHQP